LRTLQRIATVCFLGAAFAALISACGSSDATPPPAGGAGAGPGAAGATNTAGANTAGAGTAGAGTAGAGTAGAGTAGAAATGDATRGAALWVKNTLACNTCHGDHAEGLSTGAPNITKSATGGIGGFTAAQFKSAVRDGKNKEGTALCILMPKLDATQASDQDIADLYAFQQAQPAVDTAITNPAYCANSCCTGEHK
jgi:cytochrome c553